MVRKLTNQITSCLLLNIYSVKENCGKLRGSHADDADVGKGVADKIHTAVPTDALVYDSALHFVRWAMEDSEAHCLQFRFAMADFGNNNCDAYATKRGCCK